MGLSIPVFVNHTSLLGIKDVTLVSTAMNIIQISAGNYWTTVDATGQTVATIMCNREIITTGVDDPIMRTILEDLGTQGFQMIIILDKTKSQVHSNHNRLTITIF